MIIAEIKLNIHLSIYNIAYTTSSATAYGLTGTCNKFYIDSKLYLYKSLVHEITVIEIAVEKLQWKDNSAHLN